jgi:hypothetical protein
MSKGRPFQILRDSASNFEPLLSPGFLNSVEMTNFFLKLTISVLLIEVVQLFVHLLIFILQHQISPQGIPLHFYIFQTFT